MFAIFDIIRIPLMIMFFVGIFVSVRFCIRKARQFANPRTDAREDAAPIRQFPRVRVRVLEREPEAESEPEIIEVVSAMEALPPPSGTIVRRVMR